MRPARFIGTEHDRQRTGYAHRVHPGDQLRPLERDLEEELEAGNGVVQ
jgi:hypothetical protein